MVLPPSVISCEVTELFSEGIGLIGRSTAGDVVAAALGARCARPGRLTSTTAIPTNRVFREGDMRPLPLRLSYVRPDDLVAGVFQSAFNARATSVTLRP